MKTELSIPPARRAIGETARGLLLPVRRFPDRLGDRRFWNIQFMVLAATVPHYVIEAAGFTNPFETFHGLAITLYVIPLLYAALSFGWEGAILTAVWVAVVTSPSMWVWHRSSYQWLTEVGQLAITLPAGLMVAWRVDLESKQRRRAERTSAGLALLNEIGDRLSHRLDVEQALPGVVRRLREGLPASAAWLMMDDATPGVDATLVFDIADADARLDAEPATLHRQVVATRMPVTAGGQLVVVPLFGEDAVVGSIGASVCDERITPEMSEEFERILTAVAHEISASAEHARLYRERQESLQTYARQVTQAQEDERLRIARDLHDETAQELVHLVRELEQLGETTSSERIARIDELLRIARATLQSVRRVSRDLRPSILDDLGLAPAIELAVEEMRAQLPLGAQLMIVGSPRRLERTVELALFRIAHEALHNVERHAEAQSAVVTLAFFDDQVRLAIRDDGAGYSVPANIATLARTGKLGVLGMKERAELIGASFELRSAPGRGCEVIVGFVEPARRTRNDMAHLAG